MKVIAVIFDKVDIRTSDVLAASTPFISMAYSIAVEYDIEGFFRPGIGKQNFVIYGS